MGCDFRCAPANTSRKISIHAARMGCDFKANEINEILFISIHAARMGCDRGWLADAGAIVSDFNPRSPNGLRPKTTGQLFAYSNFNPRSPNGLRPEGAKSLASGSDDFNPRSPNGLRPGAL